MDIKIQLFIIYTLVINIIAILITGYDKLCAKKHSWRVKERTLMLVSVLGGSIGMYITMQLIRHKTRHFKFMVGIPLIMILQIILIWFTWSKIYG